MRVMREIMAEVGEYELDDHYIEDKFEYKKLLFPHKYASKPQKSGTSA